MTIKAGEKMPEGKLALMGADGKPGSITTGELFGGKKVVLFAVPGAFTPTCSMKHLPGFVDQPAQALAAAVDAGHQGTDGNAEDGGSFFVAHIFQRDQQVPGRRGRQAAENRGQHRP